MHILAATTPLPSPPQNPKNNGGQNILFTTHNIPSIDVLPLISIATFHCLNIVTPITSWRAATSSTYISSIIIASGQKKVHW
jgi:hypothetical protein